MKKSILVFLAMWMLVLPAFCMSGIRGYAAEAPDVYSSEALVVNVNTDEVLYHKDTNKGNAEIASLHGTSGHADQQGLVNWLQAFRKKPENLLKQRNTATEAPKCLCINAARIDFYEKSSLPRKF